MDRRRKVKYEPGYAYVSSRLGLVRISISTCEWEVLQAEEPELLLRFLQKIREPGFGYYPYVALGLAERAAELLPDGKVAHFELTEKQKEGVKRLIRQGVVF